jgi:hypothetical protein
MNLSQLATQHIVNAKIATIYFEDVLKVEIPNSLKDMLRPIVAHFLPDSLDELPCSGLPQNICFQGIAMAMISYQAAFFELMVELCPQDAKTYHGLAMSVIEGAATAHANFTATGHPSVKPIDLN